jgi:hypothetical protein
MRKWQKSKKKFTNPQFTTNLDSFAKKKKKVILKKLANEPLISQESTLGLYKIPFIEEHNHV